MRNAALAGAVVAGLSLMGGAANAQIDPQLFTDMTPSVMLENPPFTLGWEFFTNNAITINALGVFDSGQDGLTDSYEVGLWDSAGTLLAETTVTTGDTLVDQWRYSFVTPVTLAAGEDYYVGALYTTGADGVIFPDQGASETTTANITWLTGTFAAGLPLSVPTTVLGGGAGFFGPNISVAPESSTWVMMMLGFAGLGFAGWRKAKSVALAR